MEACSIRCGVPAAWGRLLLLHAHGKRQSGRSAAAPRLFTPVLVHAVTYIGMKQQQGQAGRNPGRGGRPQQRGGAAKKAATRPKSNKNQIRDLERLLKKVGARHAPQPASSLPCTPHAHQHPMFWRQQPAHTSCRGSAATPPPPPTAAAAAHHQPLPFTSLFLACCSRSWIPRCGGGWRRSWRSCGLQQLRWHARS